MVVSASHTVRSGGGFFIGEQVVEGLFFFGEGAEDGVSGEGFNFGSS